MMIKILPPPSPLISFSWTLIGRERQYLWSLLQDIGRIFSNIIDIYEFSVTFLGLLEAAIEVADEGKQPAIGECFEEMAEVKSILGKHS